MNLYIVKQYKTALTCFLFTIFLSYSHAQPLLQTLRGKIVDYDSKASVIGANVVVEASNPILGGSTNGDGEFRIEHVPIGRFNLIVTCIGYEDQYLPNLEIGTGKELVLDIQMEESLTRMDEIVVTDKEHQSMARDEMVMVSAMSFTVDETKRFAGSFNDPARMAASFAGNMGNPEGGNHIVVRGNSPNNVQWRMDGAQIPNPNHFAEEGSSGGAINMLNSAMLTTSDFYSGAFAPEYGNALGGVFDMRLRTGNNEQREYTLSAGILGTDLTIEGPFKNGRKSSYLANYRYSSLAILENLNIVDFGGVPKYQDLSFKLAFPTKKAGKFTIFGIGGLSNIADEYENDETQEVLSKGNYSASMGTFNINHLYFFNGNNSIESFVSLSSNGSSSLQKDKTDTGEFEKRYEDELIKNTLRVSSVYNAKINARNTLKLGLAYEHYYFNFYQAFIDNFNNDEVWLNSKGDDGVLQSYISWKHKLNEKLSFTTGLHYNRMLFNANQNVEPRLSAKWQFKPNQSLFAGFGVHSQMVPLTVYYTEFADPHGNPVTPNTGLDYQKAVHYVFGYDRIINNNLFFKIEAYYQDLFNIPVENDPNSSFSLVNAVDGYTDRALVNTGTGTNYGVELTLERFFYKDFYYLVTASLFDSKYTAMDGIERSTMFNTNYVANILFGKEFKLGANKDNKTLSVNTKFSIYGAQYFTPINLPASRELGRAVYFENLAFSQRGDDILKLDFAVSYKWNRKKTRQEIKIDIQNLTNNQAVVSEFYNDVTEEIEASYQLPMLPILIYTLEF